MRAAVLADPGGFHGDIVALNRMVAGGLLPVDPPFLAPWADLPALHQAMAENRPREITGGCAKAVVNHALPESGLAGRGDLCAAWEG